MQKRDLVGVGIDETGEGGVATLILSCDSHCTLISGIERTLKVDVVPGAGHEEEHRGVEAPAVEAAVVTGGFSILFHAEGGGGGGLEDAAAEIGGGGHVGAGGGHAGDGFLELAIENGGVSACCGELPLIGCGLGGGVRAERFGGGVVEELIIDFVIRGVHFQRLL